MTSKSIRFQFYSFLAVLLLVVFVLLNIFPLTTSRDAVFEEKKNTMTSRGSTAATAIASIGHLSSDNIRDVLSILDMNNYSRIVVTDEKGNVLYDSDTESSGNYGLEDLNTALSEKKTIFRSDFRNSSFVSTFCTPMSYQNEIIGALYLKETDTEQAEILLSIQNKIRIVSIMIVVVALALAIIFSSTLLRRFSELVRSMRIVANGDYSHRLAVSGRDEISSLGNEFNDMTEKFQTMEQQRLQFVSDASHELKTPLASIKLLSDSMVQSKMSPETMQEFASDISHEADRLQHITEDLLSLSRMDDDVRLTSEPVDLKPVIIDALVSIKPIADTKKVSVKCNLDEGCVIMATVDDAFHIVYNLMDNAVKYNSEGGSVDVSLSGDENEIKLTVKDTGIGIPEDERLNVFTRFYRVDKARSRSSGGTGLGLSIVHDAVKSHGGTITIGANKPRGSVFTVTFPRPSEEETGI